MLGLCGVVLLGVGTMPLVAGAKAGPTPIAVQVQAPHPGVTAAELDPPVVKPDNFGAQAVVVLGACTMLLAALCTRTRVRPT